MRTKVYFACDESGAKGYADRDESFPGEVGVFAGVLIPEELFPRVAAHFASIHRSFGDTDGKLHITDLEPARKHSLRAEIFEGIKRFRLTCFWYAIHVAGLHSAHLMTEEFVKSGRDPNAPPPRIRTGTPRSQPRSLHVELFGGLYARLVAFLMERERNEADIQVLTDPVDRPILKAFEEYANELLDEEPRVTHVTGFDTVTKEVLRSAISFEMMLPPEWAPQIDVANLELRVSKENEGIVLAADVLSNSLLHLFHHRTSDTLFSPLNSPDAIRAHPLADQLTAFYDWGDGFDFGDTIFRHPRASGP